MQPEVPSPPQPAQLPTVVEYVPAPQPPQQQQQAAGPPPPDRQQVQTGVLPQPPAVMEYVPSEPTAVVR